MAGLSRARVIGYDTGQLAVAYIVVPSLAIGLLEHVYDLALPLVNLDLVLAAIVGALCGPTLGAVALALAVAIELLQQGADLFFFTPAGAVRALWSETFLLTSPLRWRLFSVGMAIAGGAWLLGRMGGRSRAPSRSALLLATAGALLLVGDVALGTNQALPVHAPWTHLNIAGSGVWRLRGSMSEASASAALVPHGEPTARSTGPIRLTHGHHGPTHAVRILVESLGDPVDPELLAIMLAPLTSTSMRAHYAIRPGRVGFRGSTTAAELRELCGTAGTHITVQSLDLHRCLPHEYARNGARATAIHGYTGRMFNRESWYPELGFSRILFRDSLLAVAPGARCGSYWYGVCDAVIATWIGDELRAGPTQFIYWLTLNTHLPVDRELAARSTLSCNAHVLMARSRDLCDYVRLVRLTTEAIARTALRPDIAPTRFVIVGDHAPPFSEPGLRHAFSSRTVPYLILTPREQDDVFHAGDPSTPSAAPPLPTPGVPSRSGPLTALSVLGAAATR